MKQFCTFYLDQALFGVDMKRVREVIRTPPITRVPLAARTDRGLINLRGEIMAVVDLRRCLGLPDRPAGLSPLTIVLQLAEEEEGIGLLVDQIDEALDIDEHLFELPPETLQGPSKQWIREIAKLETRLLMILDIDPFLESTGGDVQKTNITVKEDSHVEL